MDEEARDGGTRVAAPRGRELGERAADANAVTCSFWRTAMRLVGHAGLLTNRVDAGDRK